MADGHGSRALSEASAGPASDLALGTSIMYFMQGGAAHAVSLR